MFLVMRTFLRLRPLSLFMLACFAAAGLKADEITLFNGKDLSAWKPPHGTWSMVGDVKLNGDAPKTFTTQPGEGVTLNSDKGKTVDLISLPEHGDCEIHVEFNVPKGSNSGIYVQGRYEVQVFDSYGKVEIGVHDCGAIYERWDPSRGKGKEGYEGHVPRVNASKSPGEWQSFVITFQAPRFDAAGNKVQNAKFLKVVHNGQIIHENVEMTGPTRGSKFPKEAALGPVVIQGDHGPVAYRNFKIISR